MASRLSDGQKQELVDRYRQGETAQSLAVAYGCSPNTVSRVLKALVDPAELATLKKQSRARGATEEPASADAQATLEASETPELVAPVVEPSALQAEPEQEDEIAAPAVLAIDDADDFGDDALDDGVDDGDDLEAASPAASTQSNEPRVAVLPRPLHSGALPASVYLLVDKTVELDARPLREFSELGSLPVEEQDRQALMLYANPRQAKRQCGRTQRVIKVPDSGVLERTSRYLVAQGITRLVLEGGDLFAIPGT